MRRGREGRCRGRGRSGVGKQGPRFASSLSQRFLVRLRRSHGPRRVAPQVRPLQWFVGAPLERGVGRQTKAGRAGPGRPRRTVPRPPPALAARRAAVGGPGPRRRAAPKGPGGCGSPRDRARPGETRPWLVPPPAVWRARKVGARGWAWARPSAMDVHRLGPRPDLSSRPAAEAAAAEAEARGRASRARGSPRRWRLDASHAGRARGRWPRPRRPCASAPAAGVDERPRTDPRRRRGAVPVPGPPAPARPWDLRPGFSRPRGGPMSQGSESTPL